MSQARARAEVSLKGIDLAVYKLRKRAQAGGILSDAQRHLLDQHGGVWPKPID